MTELTEKRCVPCEGGVPPLARAEADRLRAKLAPGWHITPKGDAIQRDFEFKDFFRTMSFVNALAHVANIEDHHPDLSVSYGSCGVTFTTHAIGGLSENDFICAAKIDLIAVE